MEQKNQIPQHTFGEIGNSSNAVMTYLKPEDNTKLYITIALMLAYLATRKR